MSILIKGMEMPKNCVECPFFESKYHFHGCHAVPKSFNDMDMWNFVGERPTWCPLIKVPKHGRLIDADALKVDDGWLDNQDGTQTHIQFVYANAIINTPTIIEAEAKA